MQGGGWGKAKCDTRLYGLRRDKVERAVKNGQISVEVFYEWPLRAKKVKWPHDQGRSWP